MQNIWDIVIHEANIVISVHMLKCACSCLKMLTHAYVLVAGFTSAHGHVQILFYHFANDLRANRSTGEECGIVLPIAFTSIMQYSVECTDAEVILSPDSFQTVRHTVCWWSAERCGLPPEKIGMHWWLNQIVICFLPLLKMTDKVSHVDIIIYVQCALTDTRKLNNLLV